ncbi:hypothetical protein ACHWQZ_G000677 [Mnemiopsis leidyi]
MMNTFTLFAVTLLPAVASSLSCYACREQKYFAGDEARAAELYSKLIVNFNIKNQAECSSDEATIMCPEGVTQCTSVNMRLKDGSEEFGLISRQCDVTDPSGEPVIKCDIFPDERRTECNKEVCLEDNCNMPAEEGEKSEDDSKSSAIKIIGNGICATVLLLCALIFV